MGWHDVRWRWSLAVGLITVCVLGFTTQLGAGPSQSAAKDPASLIVTTDPSGKSRVSIPDSSASSLLRRARWIYGSVAASAILLVAAVQYRALRRLQAGRAFASAVTPRRERVRVEPRPAHSAPWPAVEAGLPDENAWTAGLALHPGTGD